MAETTGIPARRGFVRVHVGVLRHALGLPASMEIHGIARDADDVFNDTFSLAVAGPDCPEVPIGVRAPQMHIVLQREENGRVSTLRVETVGASNEPLARAGVVDGCAGGSAFDGDPSRVVLGQGAV